MKKTLLVALFRPLAIRMILKSEVFDTLKNKKDLRIVILAPFADNKQITDKLKADNVVFRKLDDVALTKVRKQGLLRNFMATVRLFTYKNTKKEMVSRFAMMHEYRVRNLKPDSKFIAKLFHKIILSLPRFLGYSRFLRWCWVELEKFFFYQPTHQKIFSEFKPDWLIVSSLGYGKDEQLMWEAEKNGTKTLSIIQSWDNPTTKGYPGGRPDRVIVWSDIMGEQLVSLLDIKKQNIFIGGVPHWDVYFNYAKTEIEKGLFFKESGLNPAMKTIYFPTSAAKSFKYNFIVAERIAESIVHNRICEPAQLLIRLHPSYYGGSKDYWAEEITKDLKRIEGLLEKYPDIVFLDKVLITKYDSDGSLDIDRREQLRLARNFSYSSVMVNSFSTQSIEAAIFNLPIINTVFGPYKRTELPISTLNKSEHFSRLLNTGGIANATSPDEVIDLINDYLGNRQRDFVGREKIVQQELPYFKGTSGVAIGNYIHDLVISNPMGRGY